MSLKWRIASGYTALLIAVMLVSGATIVWKLHSILYDQARAAVDSTMHSIELSTQQSNPFSLEESNAGAQFLFESSNLAIWASPSTYVQVDSTGGYPISKSYNLGSKTIPSNPAVTKKNPSAYRELPIGDDEYLVKDQYLSGSGTPVVVHVAQSLAALNQTFAQARDAILTIVAVAAVAVVVFSIVLAAQATTPINALSSAMREIGSDRLEHRFAYRRRNDEIGRLAESFDDLLQRLSEAFARERQFISDASHELKTPLTSINANAQMLLRWGDRDPEVLRESLETIAKESAALAVMVNGMLTLAKADRGDAVPKEPVSLAQVASEVVKSAEPRATEKGLQLRFAHDGTPLVYGDAGLLRQQISNLVDNALKFTDKGAVDVAVGSRDGKAWVEVGDSGPGIPAEELPNVFERFYRTDKARSREVPGTGLGLAIVRSIARVHDGEVTAGRSPTGGALFRVTFPGLQISGLSETS